MCTYAGDNVLLNTVQSRTTMSFIYAVFKDVKTKLAKFAESNPSAMEVLRINGGENLGAFSKWIGFILPEWVGKGGEGGRKEEGGNCLWNQSDLLKT